MNVHVRKGKAAKTRRVNAAKERSEPGFEQLSTSAVEHWSKHAPHEAKYAK